MKTSSAFSNLALLPFLALAACAGPDSADEADAMGGESEAELVERARGIHERVITLDTHVDISPSNFTAERNYTQDLPNTQVDLPSMEEGGLDVAWLIVYVGQGDLTEEGYDRAHEQALEKFHAIHRLAEEIAPDRIGLATTSEEVREIVASGRKVAMIGVENAYQVGTDLSNIEVFHNLGGRYMSLAHNGHSQMSDSNTGEGDDDWLHGGLSDLGRQAVAEMNRLGMMIDISHPSKAANLEVLQLSRAPVIASHSSARAMHDHSRNLDDEQLLALKENGGVVQTVAFAGYVNTDRREAISAIEESIAAATGFERLGRSERSELDDAAREAYEQEQEAFEAQVDSAVAAAGDAIPGPADVADFVDHIDYMVELIGIDHVGISSDFDGGGGVEGWDDASETFNVTLELVRRGYTEEEIAQLWSGNLLRVLDEVQAVAAEIQAEG